MSVRFDTYAEYAASTSSEKITLAHIHAFAQLFNFTLDSGNLYKRVTDYFVVNVKKAGSYLTKVNSSVEVNDETKFYYDLKTSTLYLYDSAGDLESNEIIVEYKLFFSDAPINFAWDLDDDNASHVEYEPRITRAPGFKSEIGADQKGISVTGSGNISLENNDGFFDPIYDTLFFEQKRVLVYSIHRDLLPTQRQVLYRGFIVDKSYDGFKVNFKVSDSLFKLDQAIPLQTLTEADGVSQEFVGNFKRRIYGKLDGLLLRSIDQVGNGITLTGTISNDTVGATTITGTGTLFLDELTPGDTFTQDTIEYEVEEVLSDTEFTISDSDGLQTVFGATSMVIIPAVAWQKKNREFLIAGHALKQEDTTVTKNNELNRIEVAEISSIEENDILTIGSETVQVKRVSGNEITTRFNMSGLKTVGTTVTKQPVQKLYVEGKELLLDDIVNVNNTSSGCSVEISETAEFNVTPNKSLPSFVNFTWTNGSRSITTTDDIDLQDLVQSRNWIRRAIDADTEFIEILQVKEQEIITRTPYLGPNDTDTAVTRQPVIASDSNNVSANVLGKTKDNTPTGEWIRRGPEVVKDLLEEGNLSDFLDQAGFDEATQVACPLMNIKIPFDITSTSLTTIKDVVDDINETIFGSLVLNNELLMDYNILDVSLPSQDIRSIGEDDVIKFNIRSRSGKLFKDAISAYNFSDFDNIVKAQTTKVIEFSSDFVTSFETSDNTAELSLYVYDENAAQELTERFVYYNSLSQSVVEVDASLNLYDIAMGDKVLLDMRRVYNRLGDGDSRLKVGTVISVDRTGKQVKLKISDLGNLFNRSAVISADDALEYSSSTASSLMITSHITDDNGIIDNDEQTNQINLIT